MSLRVGMLAPISHPFPPSGYGPWEAVAHALTEGLVELGHEVLVFAPAGSVTSGELVATVPMALSQATERGIAHDSRVWEAKHISVAMAEAVRAVVDVVHSHLHVHALGYGRFLPMPLVSTLHGSAWDSNNHPMLEVHRDLPFVSLSDSERLLYPGLNYVATVHNGIRLAEHPYSPTGGDRLAFVGRMAPEKAPHLAVEVALRAGAGLVLAGVVEDQHRQYFDSKVRPRLGDGIEYAGPLTAPEVASLLGTSRALLMPLEWDEPFGLVVIESLAAGTPVVAWRRGAMPELIDEGVTGFLVDDVSEAVAAVHRIGRLGRNICRTVAEQRFSHQEMARGYADAYAGAIAQSMASRSSDTSTVPTDIRLSEMP